jgi:hypothetical protein
MSSGGIVKMQKGLEKAHTAMARMREKYKEHVEEVVDLAATIAGGAGAGYLDAKYGTKTLMGLTPNMAAGGALTVVGLMGWAGKQSELLGSLGCGMLAYEGGKRVYVSVMAKQGK